MRCRAYEDVSGISQQKIRRELRPRLPPRFAGVTVVRRKPPQAKGRTALRYIYVSAKLTVILNSLPRWERGSAAGFPETNKMSFGGSRDSGG